MRFGGSGAVDMRDSEVLGAVVFQYRYRLSQLCLKDYNSQSIPFLHDL